MASSSSLVNYPVGRVRYRIDIPKRVVVTNFVRREWEASVDEQDWNFYWATVQSVHAIFNPETGYRLNDSQIINHYPNHMELTRKDLMSKNVKRYRRELERERHWLADKDSAGNFHYMDFTPTTFTLPSDYPLFVEEYTNRSPENSMWIMKPAGSSQGRGVFLITKLSQIKKWASTRWQSKSNAETYVISRYVMNPFLIGGKKFDLRLYVLVTNYRPLKVYFFREGFARFCNTKYTADLSDIGNPYIHLTNVAIQKFGDDYNSRHGNKWNTNNLKLYVASTRGQEVADKLMDDIFRVVLLALKSVQSVIVNDKHCFECYGYDIMIDDTLKPWLLEVNASPSLTTTTLSDRLLKIKLLSDIMDVVVPPDFPDTKTHRGSTSWNPASTVGMFDLIYDEAKLNASGVSEAERKDALLHAYTRLSQDSAADLDLGASSGSQKDGSSASAAAAATSGKRALSRPGSALKRPSTAGPSST